MAISPPESVVGVRAVRRGVDTVVTDLTGTEPWRPRLLGVSGPVARVALVQSRASLLRGDAVALEIDLGAGCALELVELGATVAHHVRGGPAARLDTSVRLGRGARLVWLGQPLIAAAGCDVLRSTRIELATGAAVLLGEALVLGRVGEEPGHARVRTRVTLDGRPVIDETLDTQPAWLLRSAVVAGTATAVDSLLLAGLRDPEPPADAWQGHEPSTLVRRLGAARAGLAGEAVGRRWRDLVLEGRPGG